MARDAGARRWCEPACRKRSETGASTWNTAANLPNAPSAAPNCAARSSCVMPFCKRL